MKRLCILSLLLLTITTVGAFADTPVRKADVIEITMPDGTKQQGIVLDGKFVPLVKPGDQKPASGQPQIPEQKPSHSQLHVTYIVQAIHSELVSKKYLGYQVIVENLGPNPVKIINAAIVNGNNGQMAYQLTKDDTNGVKSPWNWGWAGAGFNASRSIRLNQAAEAELTVYQNDLVTGLLPVGEKTQTLTLIPVGAKPEVRLTFQDEKTGELLYSSQ